VPRSSPGTGALVYPIDMPRDDTYRLREDPRCGPWIVTAASSRVARFRWDYNNDVMQVQWRNQKNMGYLYDCGYEEFRSMLRINSKGKQINNPLNGYTYRPMDPIEYGAPVERDNAPLSRARGVTDIQT